MNVILIYFAVKYKGNWDLIYQALDKKEKVTLKEITDLEDLMKFENWQIITLLDLDYPKKLKEAYKPPFALWWKGNRALLNEQLISFTGNHVSPSVIGWIEKFTPELLNRGSLILSGFKGAEEKIAEHAKNKGIIYIESCGLDMVAKDRAYKDEDLVLTEYPFGAHSTPDTYRNRNRLIAALSQYLILVSSEKGGKINSLVSNFLNLGKDVYCCPGDGSEEDGNSDLIKQGASLVTSLSDISE